MEDNTAYPAQHHQGNKLGVIPMATFSHRFVYENIKSSTFIQAAQNCVKFGMHMQTIALYIGME